MCCHSCTPCLYSCFVLTRIVLFFLLLFFFFLLLPSLFLCLFSFAVVLDATTKQWKCVFAKVFLEMGNLPNLVKLITTAARTNGISRAQKTSSGFTARHAQPAMANHPRLWRVTMMLPCRKSGQLRWRLRMLLVLLVPQNLPMRRPLAVRKRVKKKQQSRHSSNKQFVLNTSIIKKKNTIRI